MNERNFCEEEVYDDEGSRHSYDGENETNTIGGHDQDSNPSFETDSASGSKQEEKKTGSDT